VSERIGFFGGTFDPPHKGHVELAKLAMERMHLDKVLMAPAGRQPFKTGETGADFRERMEMVKRACEGVARLEPSEMDAPRADGTLNYTVDTIARLKKEQPEAEIFLLLGADAMEGLGRWHRAEDLPAMAELVEVARPGYELARSARALAKCLPKGWRAAQHIKHDGVDEWELVSDDGRRSVVQVLAELEQDVSATELRAKLERGEGWDWLPARVAEFVRERGLYGA
jgi:nicotinate-nucleotide adenylyltransferase